MDKIGSVFLSADQYNGSSCTRKWLLDQDGTGPGRTERLIFKEESARKKEKTLGCHTEKFFCKMLMLHCLEQVAPKEFQPPKECQNVEILIFNCSFKCYVVKTLLFSLNNDQKMVAICNFIILSRGSKAGMGLWKVESSTKWFGSGQKSFRKPWKDLSSNFGPCTRSVHTCTWIYTMGIGRLVKRLWLYTHTL